MSLDLMLTPNRSLTPRGLRWVVGGVAAVFLLGGIRCLVLGLWPVLPFLALDVAALWWALTANTRAGGGHERVRLAGDDLTVTRVTHTGIRRDWRLEPLWTRVEIEETPLGEAHLFLRQRERRVRVGGCLSPDERREVGRVIAEALSAYRLRAA